MKVVFVILAGALAFAGACAIPFGIGQAPPTVPPTAIVVSPPTQAPSAPSNGNGGTVFTLQESDLNQNIARGLGSGEISNARIDIHPGERADFTATVNAGGVSLNPTLSVQFSVQNGRIVIDVLDVNVGGFGVPTNLIEPQIAQLEQTAETELNRQLDQIRANSGLVLQSISTSEDSMMLQFGR